MSTHADTIGPEELLSEVRQLLGRPGPSVTGRIGWTRYPGDKIWDWFRGRPVETVKTTDLL